MARTITRVEKTTNRAGLRASIPRIEDDRLLRGEGRFTDDVEPAHALHMAVGRSPFPRARVVAIDVSGALSMPGVEQVLVGKQVVERTNPISVLRPEPSAPDLRTFAMATDVVNYEGQPVVSVVAVDRYVAEDALARMIIEYDPLPHVSNVVSAMHSDAPVLHPDVLESNLLKSTLKSAGDPEACFAEADLVIADRFQVNRVTALPMETRAVVADWRTGAGELVMHLSTQMPHLIRLQLAETLGISESAIRVVAGDMGGGFGLKLGLYPEDVLAALHALDLGRPIKWVEDRMEHFRASTHARESTHDARIGVKSDGTIIALENIYATDLGAHNASIGSAQLTTITFAGPYRVRDAMMERRVTMTNKTPVGAYRGYGQPESNFVREVLIDRVARKLRRDPLDLRLQNLLRPDELPWTNPAGAIYDSGDYGLCLRMAADAIDYESRRAKGREPREDGRYVGIGLTSFVERTGYASAKFLAERQSRFGAHESITLRANRSGGIDVYTGVPSFGQSPQTAFTQICCEVLNVDPDVVRIHAGDTASSPLNTGAFASRTTIAAAGAIERAAATFTSKTLRLAGHMLEYDADDLEIAGHLVRVKGDPETVIELARIFTLAIVGQGLPDGEEPGLEATANYAPEAAAYAFGSAAAVVAVDPETGDFSIDQFVMVHDCGVPVNPQIVDGQVRGGLAQGFGAALMEELRYDSETGQLLNGSMLDYFAPTAADLPPIELLHTEVPSPVTPLGVRGVGEIGTIPPGAAIANAVCDALVDFGVEINALPITPESIWRAIHAGNHQAGRVA